MLQYREPAPVTPTPAGVETISPSGSTTSPLLTSSPTPEAQQTISPEPSALPSDTPTNGPTPHNPKPWLAWKPKGKGEVLKSINLPPPWIGGTRTTEDFGVYTPPGYNPQGTRHYPVVYEAPSPFKLWNNETNAVQALDSLIDAGTIPAMIVVFIDEWGAPYPDTECADSVDGKMWMETFISRTVVDYVDAHYLTIRKSAARAVMGMSTGGFCAAMLTLRHPSVFGSSISFSGYYQAGTVSATSARPFGNQPAVLQAHSPLYLVGEIPPADRSSLYFVVVADPNQAYYGPQATAFEKALKADKYPYTPIVSAYGHGWPQVRHEFQGALEHWAARLAFEGVL